MPDYSDDDTGVMFPNREKQGKQPDWRGHANFEGVDFEIAAWVRQSRKDGSEFLSLKLQRPKKRDEVPQAKPQPVPTSPPVDDDVPF